MRRRSFKVQTVANQIVCVLIIRGFVELSRDVGLRFTIVIKLKYFRKIYPTAVFFVIPLEFPSAAGVTIPCTELKCTLF
jgi:hypothetical protein